MPLLRRGRQSTALAAAPAPTTDDVVWREFLAARQAAITEENEQAEWERRLRRDRALPARVRRAVWRQRWMLVPPAIIAALLGAAVAIRGFEVPAAALLAPCLAGLVGWWFFQARKAPSTWRAMVRPALAVVYLILSAVL